MRATTTHPAVDGVAVMSAHIDRDRSLVLDLLSENTMPRIDGLLCLTESLLLTISNTLGEDVRVTLQRYGTMAAAASD